MIILTARKEGTRIRISPFVAFGRPVIRGTGIPTKSISDRFYGGESVQGLANDYSLPTVTIEEVVRAERKPADAA
jgi:uncharacterized protein (DUF433 family)